MPDPSSRPGGAAPRAAEAPFIVLLCFFIAALEGYDIQAFGVAAPRLVAELSLDPGRMGWAASIAMVGLVVGALVGGALADRIGRRPVLLISTAAFGLFSVLTALAQDYDTLMLARLATGLGFGGAMPNLIAIASDISPPRRRAATVTAVFCGMPAGGAAVALLARLGGEGMDWRTLFLIGGILPLVLLPVLWLRLPETRTAHGGELDYRLVPTLFARGRAIPTLLLWLVFIMTLVVMYLMLNWLPTLVVEKGLTPGDGAAASLAFNLSGIVGAVLLGWMADRLGYGRPLTVAYAVLAVAMLALANAVGLAAVLALSGLAGFLVLGAQYALYAVAPGLYPPHVRAAGAGAAVAVGRLGSIIGPLMAGELRQLGYGPAEVLGALVPVVVAAGAATLALSYLSRPHVEADPA